MYKTSQSSLQLLISLPRTHNFTHSWFLHPCPWYWSGTISFYCHRRLTVCKFWCQTVNCKGNGQIEAPYSTSFNLKGNIMQESHIHITQMGCIQEISIAGQFWIKVWITTVVVQDCCIEMFHWCHVSPTCVIVYLFGFEGQLFNVSQ